MKCADTHQDVNIIIHFGLMLKRVWARMKKIFAVISEETNLKELKNKWSIAIVQICSETD